MKRGFILIEVLIAAAIASIIGAALFASLYQVTRIASVVDNYASVWTRAAIMHRQMERDLLGTFIPLAAEKKEEKKEQSQEKQAQEKQAKEAPSPQEKKERKRVTHVFYGINKDTMLDTLTFITDNPMQSYWSSKAGKPKPRIARVVYRLVQEKNQKNSYTLFRQEGSDLYYDAYKQGGTKEIREYPMIEGIKQMTVSYGFIEKEEQKKEKDKNEQEKKPKKIKYKTSKEWKKEDEQKKNEKKDEKAQTIELPAFVLISVALWDEQKTRTVPFEFKIPLVAQGQPVPKPKEVPTQPAQPSGQQQQGQIGGKDMKDFSGILSRIPGLSTNLQTRRLERTQQQGQAHA